MKKTLKISLTAYLLLHLVLSTTLHASAQTPTLATSPTVTTTITDNKSNNSLTEKINDLKDKIASRVAELNLVEKRGVIGTVISTSGTQIQIKDVNGLSRFIDVDEITKFSSPSEKSNDFGISDIENESSISSIGIYNKQSKRILARFIKVISLPQVVTGVVSKKDEENFTLDLATEEQKSIIVDIEKITKTSEYSKENGIDKAGFTDIGLGEKIIITGYKDKKQQNRITATRILLFPEYPQNPKINVSITPEPTEELTPSPTSRFNKRTTISPTSTKAIPTKKLTP